jgi:hypothetical protein
MNLWLGTSGKTDEVETAQEIGRGERKEVWKTIAGLYGPE